MQRLMLILLAGLAIGLTGMSCKTVTKGLDQPVPIDCIVQVDMLCVYEIRLDGDLVFSGKVGPDKSHADRFAVLPGKHILSAEALGHETWMKEIVVLPGSKDGQRFWIVLKKDSRPPS